MLAAPRIAGAQAQSKLPVLGVLSPHPKPPPRTPSPLVESLRTLGWIAGESLVLEAVYGEGSEDRLPELAATLTAKKVDVIFAVGPEAAIAAARATSVIPIVFWGVAYPVEQGLIESFARPGRNATGVAWFSSPEVDGKRLEMLREIAPAAKRLASVWVPTAVSRVDGGSANFHRVTPSAAQKLGYEIREFAVEKAGDFEPVFAAILAWKAQALVVSGTTLTVREAQRIIDFSNQNRLPSVFTLSEFVEKGGLLSYAIDVRPTLERIANYIDRILRGAKPSELPVDLPSKYLTAVNLKTAKAQGLTVPGSILVRADRVIE